MFPQLLVFIIPAVVLFAPLCAEFAPRTNGCIGAGLASCVQYNTLFKGNPNIHVSNTLGGSLLRYLYQFAYFGSRCSALIYVQGILA